MVDMVTRTKTSPRLAGRTGNSLRTNGVFGASYTAALAVRMVPSAPCFPTVRDGPNALFDSVQCEVENIVVVQRLLFRALAIARIQRPRQQEWNLLFAEAAM